MKSSSDKPAEAPKAPPSETLTPLEIEQLRQNKKEQVALLQKIRLERT
jgi:hypothetical protein